MNVTFVRFYLESKGRKAIYDIKLRNHIIRSGSRFIEIGTLLILLSFASAVYGETGESKPEAAPQSQESEEMSAPVEEDLGFLGISLEEMMNVKVEVSSLFPEEDLVAGSSVSAISSEKWKKLGARRIHEVLNNEMSVMTYPHYDNHSIVIRGYTNNSSYKGVSALLDGIPLNSLLHGTALFHMPNWETGTLDRVELIKGPGSAIYGSDAFHGVFSMKSFESDIDTCIVEEAAGYPLYGNTNMKISRGMADNRVRIDTTASVSGQGDLDMDYEFNDSGVTGTGTRKHEYDSGTGIFKIHGNPADNLEFKAGVYTNYWSSEDFPGLGSIGSVRNKDLNSKQSRFHMGTGAVTYMFNNDISIALEGYYWEFDVESELYIDPTMYMGIDEQENRYSTKIILKQSDNAINLQWFLGCSYDNQELESAFRNIRTEDGQIVNNLGEQPESGWSRDVNSIFGQLKWGVAEDKIYFLLGGRMDNYSNFDTQITPRFGIIYLPTENSSVKALYGRAFMAPNGYNRFGSAPFIEGNSDLDPEIIDAYELIYMYKTKTFRFSVNSFYSLWKDGIISEYVPATDIYLQVNEGENRSYGGEMNLFYSMDPFAFELGLSYVKSKAIDSINAVTLQEEDKTYELFPEYSINLGLHYTLRPMDINFYINNRIYLNMEDALPGVDPDPDSLPEYYRMDINISRQFEDKWEMILDIRNVLGRKNHIPGINPSVNGIEEPGTSIVLRMTYTF